MKPNRMNVSPTVVLRLLVVLAIIIGLLPLSQPAAAAPAAQDDGPIVEGTYRGVITAVHFDISRPLRELAAEAGPAPEGDFVDVDLPGPQGPLGPQDVDTAVQTTIGSGEMPAPIANFDAFDNVLTYTPPDPVGDVGPNHYVAMANVHFAIFDKTGALLLGPLPNNSLWSGFGGDCETDNSGDPIVVYDQLADRWMLTQFTSSGPTYYDCVALSVTGDPTGSYYRWAFPATNFPDYPKYGVWPDAYYIATRESPLIGAYALNRAQMLAGNPSPQVVWFTVSENYQAGNGLLPADLDGTTLPPAGSPEFFVGTQDDGGPMGAPSDAINLWKFHVDWAVPGNSYFNLTDVILVDPFDSMFPCGGGRDCIPQPGTSRRLTSCPTASAPPAAWPTATRHARNAGYQPIGGSRPNIAGIRWYEIRDPDGSPSFTSKAPTPPAPRTASTAGWAASPWITMVIWRWATARRMLPAPTLARGTPDAWPPIPWALCRRVKGQS
jgi:hypothetical protein